jgi:hypothetical protein
MKMMEKYDEGHHSLRNILLTDESTFTLHNRPNSQNHRIWSQENLRDVFPGRTQYPQSINVWVDALNQHDIGPIRIDGRPTGPKYV